MKDEVAEAKAHQPRSYGLETVDGVRMVAQYEVRACLEQLWRECLLILREWGLKRGLPLWWYTPVPRKHHKVPDLPCACRRLKARSDIFGPGLRVHPWRSAWLLIDKVWIRGVRGSD